MPEQIKIPIIIDSRESVPYLFKKYPDVEVIRTKLDVGDFAIRDYTERLMIERKTISDLCGSFTAGRERFKGMWERATQQVRFLLIEGRLSDILWGNYRSDLDPHSLIASIMSWSIKYKFSWFCVDNEIEGQMAVYWICREFLRLKAEGSLKEIINFGGEKNGKEGWREWRQWDWNKQGT